MAQTSSALAIVRSSSVNGRFRNGRSVPDGEHHRLGPRELFFTILQKHNADRFKEAKNGVLMPVLVLFADLGKREHCIQIVKVNAPSSLVFSPSTAVDVNHTLAQKGTKSPNHGGFGVWVRAGSSVPFDETVKILHRLEIEAKVFAESAYFATALHD